MARDRRVEAALREAGVEPRRTPGNFVADIGKLKPYAVFTPFWRAWAELPRREIHGAPRKVPVPSDLRVGEIPNGAAQRGRPGRRSRASRPAAGACWRGDHTTYARTRDRLDRDTSLLSPYLHFGCISARELEQRTGGAYARQLAWRDFYAHVLLHHPGNTTHAYRRELDGIEWDGPDEHFDAWREGRTGFPVVDAGMRQLARTGWMHNRARLITACFLVKDLHIDWRRGEAHFMRYLLDGDVASNNGNWQWISSVGVDPAPLHRRLYNPALQQQRHDPDGAYVRRWLGDDYDARADRRPRRRARAHAGRVPQGPRLVSSAPMGAFTLEPRGPFTLRSAARFIAGWPPGQGDVDDEHVRLRFLVDDWSGPATSSCARRAGSCTGRSTADNEERAIAQAARIVSLDHDGSGVSPRSASATRSSASCSAPPATCARCSSTRPTRPPRGRSSPPARATRRRSKVRDALSRNGVFPAPAKLLALRAQLGLPEAKLPRLHAVARGGARGPARPRAAARRRPRRRARAAAGAAGHRPVLRRA